jgi:hypothetical protein
LVSLRLVDEISEESVRSLLLGEKADLPSVAADRVGPCGVDRDVVPEGGLVDLQAVRPWRNRQFMLPGCDHDRHVGLPTLLGIFVLLEERNYAIRAVANRDGLPVLERNAGGTAHLRGTFSSMVPLLNDDLREVCRRGSVRTPGITSAHEKRKARKAKEEGDGTSREAPFPAGIQ